jgi:arylsulfatase A-like enzyme
VERPNILLVVSDQERQRGWIPDELVLPNRRRLIDEGLEFTRHHTHSSPCSPSRASLLTGRYLPQHGVNDNVIFPGQTELSPDIPTLGRHLRDAGYATAYVGKWHLSQAEEPDLEQYGFSGWSGNDRHFMGLAGTGRHFDPIIAAQAASWLDEHATEAPWFLVVALVNPHDVMWFPADQRDYQASHPEEMERVKAFLPLWREGTDDSLPPYPDSFDEVFDTLPVNFGDDLGTKPAVHAQWLHEQQHNFYGYLDPADTGPWLRHLDYYWKLHQEGDHSLGTVLDALDASGATDDTAIVFTADHGDMCGSHGLRSKGPFVYDEIMRVPLYVRVPGVTSPGTTTDALASHVDLAATILSVGGVDGDAAATLPGRDLTPVLADPQTSVRDHIVFAQDMAWYASCIPLRYAIRGVFDGRHKYARYYGCGGSFTQYGEPARTPKQVPVDAPFDDQEHELYDLREDPHELVNLAADPGRRSEVQGWHEYLLEAERVELG